MKFWKKVYENYKGHEKISEAALTVGKVFEDENTFGEEFFDAIIARFENFDELSRNNEKENLSTNVQFIYQCVEGSLSSMEDTNMFSKRIDSYLYILQRLEEYSIIIKEKTRNYFWGATNSIEQVKQKILDNISQTFSRENGLQPNLSTNNKDLLNRMKIPELLRGITRLEKENLNLFFALCKLSLQSSHRITEHRIRWIDLLSRIKDFGVSLQELISFYISRQLGFSQFKLDVTAFVYLIRVLHPQKEASESPFITFIKLCKSLEIPLEDFVLQFQPVFNLKCKEKYYKEEHIGQFMSMTLGRQEKRFNSYLSMYTASVDNYSIWYMFFYICKHSELSPMIRNAIMLHFYDRLIEVPIGTFLQKSKSALNYMKDMNNDHVSIFRQVFEPVFNKYLERRLRDEQQCQYFYELDLKEFLQVALQLSPALTDISKQSGCLLIIRHILLRMNNKNMNSGEKILNLFRKLNDLDGTITKNIDPIMVIEDDWLKESISIKPEDLKIIFTEQLYRNLSESHYDNRWILFTWNRLLQMSFMQMKHNQINDILLKLNNWMKIVQNEVYNAKNKLTNILMRNLFELIIMKYSGSIVNLPQIDLIINYIVAMNEEEVEINKKQQVNDLMNNMQKIIRTILSLEGTCSMYRECGNVSIIHCFLLKVDLRETFQHINPQSYKFPLISTAIMAVVPTPPADIGILEKESIDLFYRKFIDQIHEWLDWFEQVSSIFLNLLHWLKAYNVEEAAQLFSDLQRSTTDPSIPLIQMKLIFEKVLALLKPFHDLRRLCHLLNCLNSFQIIDPGASDTRSLSTNVIKHIKRSERKNFFVVPSKQVIEYPFIVQDHRLVQWTVAAEKFSCNISIHFMTDGPRVIINKLFQNQEAPLDKTALQGSFETQTRGTLFICIDNLTKHNPRTIWFRIKQTPLSTCHLFHGIFKMHYKMKYGTSHVTNKSKHISELLDKVFSFIDSLLDGKIRLRDMSELKTLFCDKNINVREEVKKLFSNRSSETTGEIMQVTANNIPFTGDVEQVCGWLQIYQYYSHVNIILKCIETFDIVPTVDNDNSITNLQRLTDENYDLKQIATAYKILKQQFQKLKSQHLQLIKTVVEYPSVVETMKKSGLYSIDGRRRFQELRDNLTTQFQLQERNNMILNSWIVTYGLCEPFIEQVESLDEFIKKLSSMADFDESSVAHLKIVNDNIQIVSMWLSAEAATVLDNALITMEHIYRSGIVHMHLRHLMNEESYFEIEYSISKVQSSVKQTTDSDELEEQTTTHENPQGENTERIKFMLSMADIDDHKRQLTFCNVDLHENMIYKKILLQEQMKLLKIVSNIFSLLTKLEMSGHPKYQLKDESYRLFDRKGELDEMIINLKNEENIRPDRFELIVKKFTEDFVLTHSILETMYKAWIKCLEDHRQETALLQLFSNHQVMILILLLTNSTRDATSKHELLKKLSLNRDSEFTDQDEYNLTIHYLTHYLRSLRIGGCDLKKNRIQRIFDKNKIDSKSDVNDNLGKLCQFLKEIFDDGRELLQGTHETQENLQYLICPQTRVNAANSPSLQDDLDVKTICILLSICQHRLPSSFQILWCSTATEDDIRLFFARIRTFRRLIFVILEIDRMHHRLREILLNEQDALTRHEKPHGSVYYFSRELTCRKGLRSFIIPSGFTNPTRSQSILRDFFRKNNWTQPQTQVVCGAAGIGKTYRIKTDTKANTTLTLSINDRLNLTGLINAFLAFDSLSTNPKTTVFFNISINAPFQDLNRTLFSLLVAGSVIDTNTGLTFSLPTDVSWKFLMEIPHNDKLQFKITENVYQLLPLLSVIAPDDLTEITDTNNQLHIGDEEELIARFLKAYENKTIDQLAVEERNGDTVIVEFDRLKDSEECRRFIRSYISDFAPHLLKNKIAELSFTKFLYRRVQFFTHFFYQMNISNKQLGSTVMRQMIQEAIALSSIDFTGKNYPRVFLVYDREFALHLLYDSWDRVHPSIRELFKNHEPIIDSKSHENHFIECLAWLINIQKKPFEQIMDELHFILTENFTYKLFHIHERKLTKLSLIIEGHTGVGKTFLLKFYSLLLNANITKGPIDNDLNPGIRERTSMWLANTVLLEILPNDPDLLNDILLKAKSKLIELLDKEKNQRPLQNAPSMMQLVFVDNTDHDDLEEQAAEELPRQPMQALSNSVMTTIQEHDGRQDIDKKTLEEMRKSLLNHNYTSEQLKLFWRTIITAAYKKRSNMYSSLTVALHEYISTHLTRLPLIDASVPLQNLLKITNLSTFTIQNIIELFNEFLLHTEIKPLFYRLLLHPGVTEKQLEEFMHPICQLARRLPDIELVVFFDEVNTASCLGLFKEMFIDKTLHGKTLPNNIFFTAAINPFIKLDNPESIHRGDYLVHELPQSLSHLKVSYSALDAESLREYIEKKISKFCLQINGDENQSATALERLIHTMLTDSIVNAQEFCEKYLGHNSVSQREIQRCFNLIEFFWRTRFDNDNRDDTHNYRPDHKRCIALALALTYYFRLPTEEDNLQRKNDCTPPREKLALILSKRIPDFVDIIENELESFVNENNFVIPQGVAINQAIREHIFAIVVSVVTRTPLCIIGAPGQSKTLSFQIVLQNLQGPQLSPKTFCKALPAIDPFFCLGSKYSRAEDIAYSFERAIKREQNYQQNRINTRCVVFLDEASLPDEKKMVLKVLHPYLDECRVAFVAIANKSFDAANANRMICIYRSLPSDSDQKILAYGCLGLQISHVQQAINERLNKIIDGLCQGYRRVLTSDQIPHIYHDRDFIYMLRELRFELNATVDEQEAHVDGISPDTLLRALEDNFNGISRNQFENLVKIFFQAVQESCGNFQLPIKRRNVPTILRESMKIDSIRRRLYGRYKLIIDESEDESAVRLLAQTGVLDLDPNKTTVFRMSDFIDDIDNELRNVEILSTIKLCMETGKTILMVNTGRIHGSLYDVFNQNFSIMATGENRKIWSKVAIGPKTIDVAVHEDFQCIVHVKRSEFEHIPAPFLSRFQKYSLSVNDFYQIQLQKLTKADLQVIKNVEQKVQTFIEHFGQEYFYGLNEHTLYSCLLSFIKKNETNDTHFLNVHQQYTQLTLKSKSFVEQNPIDIQQCLLRAIVSKLIQLVSPESIILKLPSLEDSVGRLICINYFQQQEHFNIENFIRLYTTNAALDIEQDIGADNDGNVEQNPNTHRYQMTTKVMIFTRTSSNIMGLNEQSKRELFNAPDDFDPLDPSTKISIINLSIVENSCELEENFHKFENEPNANLLMVVINARTVQQCKHIPYVRQLIDKTEYRCNAIHKKQKFFLLLIHSPAQTIYHQSSFPSIFLHDWDFFFFDTCLSGNSFHLQKFLQIITSSNENQTSESPGEMLCDLNSLFDNCLWDFCSRIQIVLQDLPQALFHSQSVYDFYSRHSSTVRRVQCLKEILRQSTQLQRRIVEIYHTHLAMKKDSSKKIYTMIYQISKDILCGKRFDGLVDSIQTQTRLSFTSFVSNIFKYIVNDYGLDTLPKLSKIHEGYGSMLELIDWSSFSIDNENNALASNVSETFQLVTHYACIPQTPLYHLFHQRIKSYADEIKQIMIQKSARTANETDDGSRRNYYSAPPATTTTTMMYDIQDYDEHRRGEYQFEEFRFELMKSLMRDRVLMNIVNDQVLRSYSTDLVQTCCTIVEKNFENDLKQYEKTIEFVSRWLLLVDENDQRTLNETQHKNVWLLAHLYASFEYDQHDLFSLYSACRITDRLDPTRSFYDELFAEESVTRMSVRETLFRRMFDYLWNNLEALCKGTGDEATWILNYTLISKYYPSDKVLEYSRLLDVRHRIEFMNLAYLILFNDKTVNPKVLLTRLVESTGVGENDDAYRYATRSEHKERFALILQCVHQYFKENHLDDSSLMLDIQQWIVTTLKPMKESCQDEIRQLISYFYEADCPLSCSVKKFLFDELVELYIEHLPTSRAQTRKVIKDSWDRLVILLPILIDWSDNGNSLENYQLPHHPSLMDQATSRPVLLDLLFFYIKRRITDEIVGCQLINKIIQSDSPSTQKRNQMKAISNTFKQFKDYFILYSTALVVCEPIGSEDDQKIFEGMLKSIINDYLSADENVLQLTPLQEIFFSTIISKRSWHFLLIFLQRNQIEPTHQRWTTTFQDLFALKRNAERNTHLQLYHQLQFALSPNTNESIFPTLHQPYHEIREIMDRCTKMEDEAERWTLLTDWIQQQQQMNPKILELTQIKVILLLNIYYDYYCSNQLDIIQPVLTIVENYLEPLPEEILVFRTLMQPKQSMVGYPHGNGRDEVNALNRLFTLNFDEEDELAIRHCMVNLMAMILLGGKQSFLWRFAFEPLTLEHTFGFGSTTHTAIVQNGVHYDCGCVISVNGDLVQFPTEPNPSVLNVPAVYVVYFATFGAMAWHLLLYEQSVNNLHGPILSPHAIADTSNTGRIAGETLRTKVCHFVRARLISTFGFLSNRFNQEDACILMNRSFERMTFLTMNQEKPENTWIKPVYQTLNDELNAEKEYQEHVFFHVHQKLDEFKAYINDLNLQSKIQTNLQTYVNQLPIMIHYQHFKTELHNPMYSALPLNVLRYILNSPDFLSITRSIYDLSQFYLLIHQTYSLLVERDEFLKISLEELHKRGQEHYRQSDNLFNGQRNNNHMFIIDNGIKAVNNYHQFTDGLIRPGACDATQRFVPISLETLVHNLVTTGDHEDSNIIMRILSVLVDYHDGILNLLEKEFNDNENESRDGYGSMLTKLVNKLTSKEVSILQIARDNTGVITLSKADFNWIERLSCASLQDDNQGYFHTNASQLRFDFLHIQSFIIRTYLLLCRINYRHIEQRYQCHVRKTTNDFEEIELNETYRRSLEPRQIENDWNHLRQLPFDKLSQDHQFLRQIMFMIKSNEQDLSQMTLAEFINKILHDQQLNARMDQLEIKDFQLCHIHNIQQLYLNSIQDFQHLFNDVSHLLHVPIPPQIDAALAQMLGNNLVNKDDYDDVDKLKSTVQTITELLNDIRDVENFLLQRSAQPLTEICKHMSIENPILQLVTPEIKCENYVAFSIHLIRIRAVLQEKTMNIKEKELKLWFETFDNEKDPKPQTNRFHDFLNPEVKDENQTEHIVDEGDWNVPLDDVNHDIPPSTDYFRDEEETLFRPPTNTQKATTTVTETPIIDEGNDYVSLFELHLKTVPWTSALIFERLHQVRQTLSNPIEVLTKASKIIIKHPDGKAVSLLVKQDTVLDKLKKTFAEGKYDQTKLTMIDKDQLMVDFNNPDTRLARPISLEYSIIERSLLIHVEFAFKENSIEYWAMPSANLLDVVQRFLSDYQRQLPTLDRSLGFFDSYGNVISDRPVDALVRTTDEQPNKSVTIIAIDEEDDQTNALCEIRLRSQQGEEKIESFYHRIPWDEVNTWLKSNPLLANLPTNSFAYFDRTRKIILDPEQSIGTILESTKSSIIDGIRQDSTIHVKFFFETNSYTTCALTSMKIDQLLNDEQLCQRLNLKNMSSDDFVLVLGETNDQILSADDLQKSVSEYLNNDDQTIHFRISLIIQIYREGTNGFEQFPLFNSRIKLNEIFEKVKGTDECYKYLASHLTKKILDLNEDFPRLNENKFILVEEQQICLVQINRLNDANGPDTQRFISSATIADVCRGYEIDLDNQCLVYADDFVPSSKTPLNLFGSKSPIEFTTANENFPIHIVIENPVTNQTIKFHCSLSITVERLFSITCLLFGTKGRFYRLRYDDCDLDNDDQMALGDFHDANVSQVELKFISTATMRCSIQYGERTILLPCIFETTMTELLNEVFEQWHMPLENMPMFELIAIDEDKTSIDDEFSVADVCELFSTKPETIPFELKKKD